ncbi:MAG: hypothetical protein A3K67_08065 [Euryarchaeota archaeon RBG_16_62_10]|nr:MAG: hypothetical protein A3K67_08065 [Euryarchaeota archaeon RBG_16_62_10]
MSTDLTALDPHGWEAVKKALNQRVVVGGIRLVPSKRNRVWIVETDVRPVVVKRFLTGRCGAEFETTVEARKAGLLVPYPLHSGGDCIVYEYISGEGCETSINHMFSPAAAEGIGDWLAKFHDGLSDGSSKRIMVDAVLSNFLVSEGQVYGLDLEDARYGDPLEDLGRAAASILGSEPFFTPIKFDLCSRMIARYERESGTSVLEPVRRYISNCLRADAAFRPLFRRTFVSAANSLERGWPELG